MNFSKCNSTFATLSIFLLCIGSMILSISILFSFQLSTTPSSGIALSPMIKSQDSTCPFSYSIIFASIINHFELLNSGNCISKLAHLVIWKVLIVKCHTCIRAHMAYGGQFKLLYIVIINCCLSLNWSAWAIRVLYFCYYFCGLFGHQSMVMLLLMYLGQGPKNAQFH